MPVGYACNNIVPCQKGEKPVSYTHLTDVGERASIMCENQLRGLDAVCHTELEKTTIDVIYEGVKRRSLVHQHRSLRKIQ